MTTHNQSNTQASSSRRDFLKKSTSALAGGAVINSAMSHNLYAAGSDILRVGLVGCGGRGSGAANNALNADPNTRLVAMADAFGDRLESSYKNLKNSAVGGQVEVDDDHKFVGFDAYQKLIDTVDVVLLCTPPHFRPEQLKAAIAADKHVFCEKPVAVDAPGIRSVLETSEKAREKNLTLVSGLCWRYHSGMRATFDEIHKGTIGEIVAMQCSYNSQGVWEPRKTRDECDSEMEYQMRNWYYYTWLSGDFNVEQHIHSLDKIAWAMQDEVPISVEGSGGRQQRTDPKYGNIYDHFNIVYEYASGVKAFARCRHFRGCSVDVSDHIIGTKGRADVFKHRILDHQGETVWRFRGKSKNMYQVEHDEMFASIRDGKPINNGYYMAMSSMLAIAGRMVAYTGKKLTWDEIINSQEDLTPPSYEWTSIEVPQVAVPGVTPFV